MHISPYFSPHNWIELVFMLFSAGFKFLLVQKCMSGDILDSLFDLKQTLKHVRSDNGMMQCREGRSFCFSREEIFCREKIRCFRI